MKKLFLLGFLLSLVLPLNAQTEIDCTSPLEIWQVQGTGSQANCLRERVRLENNIVTAIGAKGFFIQTPAERSDNDSLSSDGIYVYTNLPAAGFGVQVGDIIHVEGRVTEFFDLSQVEIVGRRQVEIISSGHLIPEAFNLFEAALDWDVTQDVHPLERYEGMLVQVQNAFVVAQTNYFDEFGISLTDERQFREMGIERDLTPEFVNRGLPEFDLNPALIEVDPPEMGLPVVMVTVNSQVTVTGALSYSYQDYQIWPSSLDINLANFAARPVRERAEGEFTVATQNVLNLFDILDDPRRDDSTTEDYVADNADAYQVQLRKHSLQIRENLGAPDIVAIQEIENARTLSDLVYQIAIDEPSLRYFPCIIEGNDGRGIDNAFIVNTARVNVNACYAMPDSLTVGAPLGGGFLFERIPLVLDVDLLIGRRTIPLTLINMHVKSLSGAETEIVQRRRMAQAVFVADYIQARLHDNPDANIAVLGDLNAFQFSDGLVDVVGIMAGNFNPDEALFAPENDTLEPNLLNLIERLPESERYSYIYNSTAQVLDHILVSPHLDNLVVDVQYSRGNAEALYPLEYEDNTPLRSSDHDGLVMYLSSAE